MAELKKKHINMFTNVHKIDFFSNRCSINEWMCGQADGWMVGKMNDQRIHSLHDSPDDLLNMKTGSFHSLT